MVDSVKNAISRIETPKARKADIPLDRGAKGLKSAQPQAAASVNDSVQLKSAGISSSVKGNGCCCACGHEKCRPHQERDKRG